MALAVTASHTFCHKGGIICISEVIDISPSNLDSSLCFLQPSISHHVQFSSVAQSCPTVCNPMNHSTPGLPVHHHSRNLPKLMSIESVMPSSHLILCRPLLLLPPIPPSIRVFSNESALRMRWPKYGPSQPACFCPI